VRCGVEITGRAREVIDRVAGTGLIKIPDDAWWTSDDVGSLLREVAVTYHHPAGTCRMGIDDTAVGDANLKLAKVSGPFDLIFQDGHKPLYSVMLDRLVALRIHADTVARAPVRPPAAPPPPAPKRVGD